MHTHLCRIRRSVVGINHPEIDRIGACDVTGEHLNRELRGTDKRAVSCVSKGTVKVADLNRRSADKVRAGNGEREVRATHCHALRRKPADDRGRAVDRETGSARCAGAR